MKPQAWTYSSNAEVPEGADLPAGVQRYAACVEYDGSNYCGWQFQDHSPSVQQAFESALSRVADEPLRVVCAGRTDTGVHASGQVVHFDSRAQRSDRQWTLGVNANLPPDISVRWVQKVSARFHARFSAQARRYIYLINNQPTRPALLARQVTWWREPLEVADMSKALAFLAGEHDFSAFRAAGCQAHSPVRHVGRAEISRREHWLVLDIEANAFLHHMVRNIAGTLLAVGSGQLDPEAVARILASKDRTRAPPTAPAHGLYLVDISYAPRFGLPRIQAWPQPFSDEQ